jgi:hypothetical protein
MRVTQTLQMTLPFSGHRCSLREVLAQCPKVHYDKFFGPDICGTVYRARVLSDRMGYRAEIKAKCRFNSKHDVLLDRSGIQSLGAAHDALSAVLKLKTWEDS